ncbi:MAG: pyruvate ferredoxin oxidoreductase [Planctomycetota bacterium]|nr:MAG: pyruvate ferredoxin oxidoreductase [Planctomycetota bacterium]
MGERTILTGNDAAALAFMHVNPDVAAVFPITPQTELMHQFTQYVADGEVDTELIPVESEHSAMSAALASALSGARTITASSSAGLALMWEMLYVTASSRAPVVMVDVNRALSAPINIHCDHSDSMGARDAGWIQIFSENTQESYDNAIQAFRIAEHSDVQLPVMVTLDGFILSHTMEVLEILDRETVQKFVGEYNITTKLLDFDNPVTMGPLALTPHYFECKRQQIEAMENARKVILDIGKEYGRISGRSYGYFEEYKLDDAEVGVMVLGSTAGTAKVAVDLARDKGIKAGLLKLRVFRPFPGNEIVEAIKHLKALAVMDRSASFGLTGGPVFNEVRSASYGAGIDTLISSVIYGLGGRDTYPEQIADLLDKVRADADAGKVRDVQRFVGLRE